MKYFFSSKCRKDVQDGNSKQWDNFRKQIEGSRWAMSSLLLVNCNRSVYKIRIEAKCKPSTKLYCLNFDAVNLGKSVRKALAGQSTFCKKYTFEKCTFLHLKIDFWFFRKGYVFSQIKCINGANSLGLLGVLQGR